MAQDLFLAPIEAIEFTDILDLVTTHAEEGIRLEFKEALSAPDGRQDRWMVDQSNVGRIARDDIAKEIVAFANAYGGVIVVGIVETDDHPKRAKQLAAPQIPRVADCADRLARALRSVVDPPLPMLEVRGIPSSTNGDGVIMIRIGSSPSAPHGFGTPPMTYVRHGSESAPLSMRELQSMFFERRTRLERIESRRSGFSAMAKDLWKRRNEGRLRKLSGEGAFAPALSAVLFRCSLVATDDFAIDNFPDRFSALKHGRSPKPSSGGLIDLPEFVSQWHRRYRGIEHIDNAGDRRYWCASIEADGSINQIGISAASRVDAGVEIRPASYALVIFQGMILAEWLRRWAARPDVEYALDGEFINGGGAYIAINADFDENAVVSWQRAAIGPYSIGRRATFQNVFDVIERELWDAFGVPRRSPLNFDLDQVFRSIEL
jgi:hypothetical protein